MGYLWWGNARVTPWMYYRLAQLDEHLRRLFGVGLVGNSGIRTAEEQVAIFTARYTLTPNGRRVYDTRWWNGRLWYRVSSAGTVAVPTTSNHEIQGDTAAVDIADTGNDAGITAKNSTRGRWIRDNAKYFDLVAEGDSFAEGWHFKMLGIFRTPPTPEPAPAAEAPQGDEEDDMATIEINGNFYTFARESITHNLTQLEYTLTKNVSTTTDEVHHLNNVDELVALMHGYGIPESVLDKEGKVLDVAASWRNGKRTHAWGATWSRGIEQVEAARQIFAKVGVVEFK